MADTNKFFETPCQVTLKSPLCYENLWHIKSDIQVSNRSSQPCGHCLLYLLHYLLHTFAGSFKVTGTLCLLERNWRASGPSAFEIEWSRSAGSILTSVYPMAKFGFTASSCGRYSHLCEWLKDRRDPITSSSNERESSPPPFPFSFSSIWMVVVVFQVPRSGVYGHLELAGPLD